MIKKITFIILIYLNTFSSSKLIYSSTLTKNNSFDSDILEFSKKTMRKKLRTHLSLGSKGYQYRNILSYLFGHQQQEIEEIEDSENTAEVSLNPLTISLEKSNTIKDEQNFKVFTDGKIIYLELEDSEKIILFDDTNFNCLTVIKKNKSLDPLVYTINELIKHLPKDISLYKRFSKVMIHFFWIQYEKNLDFSIDDANHLITLKVNFLFFKKDIPLQKTLSSCIPQVAQRLLTLENFFLKETLDYLYNLQDIQESIFDLIKCIKAIVVEKQIYKIPLLVEKSKIQFNT